jgi:hypothetical protein
VEKKEEKNNVEGEGEKNDEITNKLDWLKLSLSLFTLNEAYKKTIPQNRPAGRFCGMDS